MTTTDDRAGAPATATATSATSAAATTDGEGDYTHAQILTILSGLLLGMFLAALDQSIVSTSIRTIADDLQGLSAQAWVTTAYLITSTITTPIYGKLGDLYGRKKLFLFAITVFILGSAVRGAQEKLKTNSSVSPAAIVSQIDHMGVRAVPIIALMSFLIGAIIAQ